MLAFSDLKFMSLMSFYFLNGYLVYFVHIFSTPSTLRTADKTSFYSSKYVLYRDPYLYSPNKHMHFIYTQLEDVLSKKSKLCV